MDVRDVAKAHILAIQTEKAGGERIIVSTGAWKWQDWSKRSCRVKKIATDLSWICSQYRPQTGPQRTRRCTRLIQAGRGRSPFPI